MCQKPSTTLVKQEQSQRLDHTGAGLELAKAALKPTMQSNAVQWSAYPDNVNLIASKLPPGQNPA